jgi:hypothetical protein
MPLETVYRILRSMVKNGELDNDMVELFISEEIYKIYQEKHVVTSANIKPFPTDLHNPSHG